MGKTAAAEGKQLARPQAPEDRGRASEGSSTSGTLGEEGWPSGRGGSCGVGVGIGWDPWRGGGRADSWSRGRGRLDLSRMGSMTPAGFGGSQSPSNREMRGRGADGGQACARPGVLLELGLETEVGGSPGGAPGLLSAELHLRPGAGHGLLLWPGSWATLATRLDRGPESPQPGT